MKLIYRDTHFKLPVMFALIFLFVLLTNDSLTLLLYGDTDVETEKISFKLLAGIAIIFSLLNFPSYPMLIKKYFIIVFILLIIVILESYYSYNSFFQYPHVFSKLIIVFYFFLVYPYFIKNTSKKLRIIAFLILAIFALDIILYNDQVLTVSSFMESNRGFSAGAVYLLLLPCLYFLNRYTMKYSFFDLGVFLATLFLIIFLQHRTVWIATAIAIILNFYLLRKKNEQKLRMESIGIMVVISIVLLLIVSSLVLTKNPEILDKFSDRFSDIVNYKTQGTGGWRYEQFSSYMPFIKKHILYGMRFEAFELPIQFYDHNNQQPWEDGTGHHIHSFYVDILFYFGIVGFLLLIAPIIYLIRMTIKLKSLTHFQIGLISFVLSGITYGLAYNLPTFYFSILGIAYASIYPSYKALREEEQKQETTKPENIEQLA